MASGDDKQEEEEFEDIPSEVDGDVSEVGNTSAQEKFDKHKKVVKESSKDNDRKARKRTKERERRRKEESGQQARKEEKKEGG
jgi:hypothetical protein